MAWTENELKELNTAAHNTYLQWKKQYKNQYTDVSIEAWLSTGAGSKFRSILEKQQQVKAEQQQRKEEQQQQEKNSALNEAITAQEANFGKDTITENQWYNLTFLDEKGKPLSEDKGLDFSRSLLFELAQNETYMQCFENGDCKDYKNILDVKLENLQLELILNQLILDEHPNYNLKNITKEEKEEYNKNYSEKLLEIAANPNQTFAISAEAASAAFAYHNHLIEQYANQNKLRNLADRCKKFDEAAKARYPKAYPLAKNLIITGAIGITVGPVGLAARSAVMTYKQVKKFNQEAKAQNKTFWQHLKDDKAAAAALGFSIAGSALSAVSGVNAVSAGSFGLLHQGAQALKATMGQRLARAVAGAGAGLSNAYKQARSGDIKGALKTAGLSMATAGATIFAGEIAGQTTQLLDRGGELLGKIFHGNSATTSLAENLTSQSTPNLEVVNTPATDSSAMPGQTLSDDDFITEHPTASAAPATEYTAASNQTTLDVSQNPATVEADEVVQTPDVAVANDIADDNANPQAATAVQDVEQPQDFVGIDKNGNVYGNADQLNLQDEAVAAQYADNSSLAADPTSGIAEDVTSTAAADVVTDEQVAEEPVVYTKNGAFDLDENTPSDVPDEPTGHHRTATAENYGIPPRQSHAQAAHNLVTDTGNTGNINFASLMDAPGMHGGVNLVDTGTGIRDLGSALNTPDMNAALHNYGYTEGVVFTEERVGINGGHSLSHEQLAQARAEWEAQHPQVEEDVVSGSAAEANLPGVQNEITHTPNGDIATTTYTNADGSITQSVDKLDINGTVVEHHDIAVYRDVNGGTVREDAWVNPSGEPVSVKDIYDADGKLTSSEGTWENDSDKSGFRKFYDAEGNLTRREDIVYTYDSHGNHVTQSTIHDGNDNCIGSAELVSDADGNPLYATQEDSDGNLVSTTEYSLHSDSATQQYSEIATTKDVNGQVISETSTTYVDGGNSGDRLLSSKETVYNPDRSFSTTERQYDKYGALTSTTRTDYDAEGNLLNTEQLNAKGEVIVPQKAEATTSNTAQSATATANAPKTEVEKAVQTSQERIEALRSRTVSNNPASVANNIEQTRQNMLDSITTPDSTFVDTTHLDNTAFNPATAQASAEDAFADSGFKIAAGAAVTGFGVGALVHKLRGTKNNEDKQSSTDKGNQSQQSSQPAQNSSMPQLPSGGRE